MFFCYNIKISLCFSVTISQYRYVSMLQYHNIVMFFSVTTSQYRYAFLLQRQNIAMFFTISQCRDVFLLQYCNVPMLQIYDILQLVHC